MQIKRYRCEHMYEDGTPCAYEWMSRLDREPRCCPQCKQRKKMKIVE